MSWGAIAATAACFAVILIFLFGETQRIGQFRTLTSVKDLRPRR